MFMKVGATWYEVNPVEEARVDDLDPELVAKALADPNRHDPLKKVSPKGIGSRRITSDEKNVVAAYMQVLKPGADKRAYSKAKMAWTRYKASMETEFVDLVNQLDAGRITKNQFLARSRKIFKAGYERAYRLGTDAAGLDFMKLPKEDLRWLARARSHEYKFLNKFADDIVAKRGTMSYRDRAAMYVRNTDGMFDAGRVDGYPNESTWVYWELGASEQPCGDCIDLAMNSPYRPDQLPTTPRAGNTQCLSNCNCSLRIRYERPERIVFDVKPAPRSLAKTLGLIAVGTTIVKAKKALQKTKKDLGVKTPDVGDFEDWEGELESVHALDWNAVDDAVSALTLSRSAEIVEDRRRRAAIRIEAARDFESACRRLPPWIDPFSRDLLTWQAIGTVVLDHVNDSRRKEAMV